MKTDWVMDKIRFTKISVLRPVQSH